MITNRKYQVYVDTCNSEFKVLFKIMFGILFLTESCLDGSTPTTFEIHMIFGDGGSLPKWYIRCEETKLNCNHTCSACGSFWIKYFGL